MRKTVTFVLAILLLASPMAFAADKAQFAVLDVQRVVDDSNHGKKISDLVKEFSAKKRVEVEKKIEEREQKAMDLEKKLKSGVIAEEAAQKTIEEFQKYALEVDEFARQAENEARDFATEQKKQVIKDLDAVINKVSEERGYLIVFRYENVVYADESVPDVTDDIIVEYDAMKKAKEKK